MPNTRELIAGRLYLMLRSTNEESTSYEAKNACKLLIVRYRCVTSAYYSIWYYATSIAISLRI